MLGWRRLCDDDNVRSARLTPVVWPYVKSNLVRGLAFLALVLATISAALLTSQFTFIAVAISAVAFLLAGSVLSNAGQIASSLRPFVRRSVHVAVWGQSLPATDAAAFQVDSIRALGAGLLIHLRPGLGQPHTLLKVAQPSAARPEDDRIEIAKARYVSWGGVKLKPNAAHPALSLIVTSSLQ